MTEKKTIITIPVDLKGLTSGRTTFKTGTQKTRKDRARNRKDKYGKRNEKESTYDN